LLAQIMDEYFREGDRSQFGLANAVTAVARETRDPELRWNLGGFGGGIAIASLPPRPSGGGRAAKRRMRRAVALSQRRGEGAPRRVETPAGEPAGVSCYEPTSSTVRSASAHWRVGEMR